jgi:hypothetical protein
MARFWPDLPRAPAGTGSAGAHGEQRSALGRARKLNVDVAELPLAAGGGVLDDQRSFLETDLAEIDAVEAAFLEAVQPADELRILERLGARLHWQGPCGALGFDPAVGSGRDRRRVRAGGDRNPAVMADMDGGLRADKINALRAEGAEQQAARVKADLGARSACEHLAFGSAHADTADPEDRRAGAVVVEARAPDADPMAGSELAFERGLDKGAGEIERDQSAHQQDVEPAETDNAQAGDLEPGNPSRRLAEQGAVDAGHAAAETAPAAETAVAVMRMIFLILIIMMGMLAVRMVRVLTLMLLRMGMRMLPLVRRMGVGRPARGMGVRTHAR